MQTPALRWGCIAYPRSLADLITENKAGLLVNRVSGHWSEVRPPRIESTDRINARRSANASGIPSDAWCVTALVNKGCEEDGGAGA